MADDIDFEEDWDLIRQKSPIRLVGTRGGDIDGQVELAATTALADTIRQIQELADAECRNAPVTPEVFARFINIGVNNFMKSWHQQLRGVGLPGLIEIVLEGQQLPPQEMKGFMEALPTSFLRRVAESAVGSASGTHGLVALEYHRRMGAISSYEMGEDKGRVWVRFAPSPGISLTFFLDEPFDPLPTPPGV